MVVLTYVVYLYVVYEVTCRVAFASVWRWLCLCAYVVACARVCDIAIACFVIGQRLAVATLA